MKNKRLRRIVSLLLTLTLVIGLLNIQNTNGATFSDDNQDEFIQYYIDIGRATSINGNYTISWEYYQDYEMEVWNDGEGHGVTDSAGEYRYLGYNYYETVEISNPNYDETISGNYLQSWDYDYLGKTSINTWKTDDDKLDLCQ